MFGFFLSIMKQKCGYYINVQLLQMLNILFENIKHETSLCKFYVICFNISTGFYKFEIKVAFLKT